EPKDDDPLLENVTDYQKLIGKLIYLTTTRPDIAYTISCLTYTDADWARGTNTRRSVIGFCIFMNESLVSWKNKNQNTISKSSTKAEYKALASMTSEVISVHKILKDLECSNMLPVKKFIKAIHGVREAIDNPNFSNRGSLWLDLIREFLSLNHKGIDLLPSIKRKLGNDEITLFWEDIWLGEAKLKTKYPRLFALESRKGSTVAAKIGQPSLDHSFRRLPRGGVEGEQYRDLCSITSEVLLPQTLDRWVWSLNASGDFSLISVRNLIDDALLPKSNVPTRWIKLVPIKINILA
ncbi:hypothetical protein Tco_1181350, partial [Tanacetum coccineum]